VLDQRGQLLRAAVGFAGWSHALLRPSPLGAALLARLTVSRSSPVKNLWKSMVSQEGHAPWLTIDFHRFDCQAESEGRGERQYGHRTKREQLQALHCNRRSSADLWTRVGRSGSDRPAGDSMKLARGIATGITAFWRSASNRKKAAPENEEDLRGRYFDAATHYYVAARFAYFARAIPTAGNLFHHAIEMYLKGCLVQTHDEGRRRRLTQPSSDMATIQEAGRQRQPETIRCSHCRVGSF